MDPNIHWGPYGPTWEFEIFGTLHATHWGPYIGSTWDPTWGPPEIDWLHGPHGPAPALARDWPQGPAPWASMGPFWAPWAQSLYVGPWTLPKDGY